MKIDHRQVAANGLQFHVATAGSSEGPLVMVLHGFPRGPGPSSPCATISQRNCSELVFAVSIIEEVETLEMKNGSEFADSMLSPNLELVLSFRGDGRYKRDRLASAIAICTAAPTFLFLSSPPAGHDVRRLAAVVHQPVRPNLRSAIDQELQHLP